MVHLKSRMRNAHVWREDELEYVIANCEAMTDKEMADRLSSITGEKITLDMVRDRRITLVGRRPSDWEFARNYSGGQRKRRLS